MRRISRTIIAGAAAAAMAGHGAEMSATAAASVAVDSREGVRRVVATQEIGYSPSWCGVESNGAYVVIEKVEHAGMFNEASTTLATLGANAEGEYAFAPASGDAPCLRLVHRAFASDGTEIGTPLVADLAFGFSGGAASGSTADGRGDLLQREAAVGKIVGLAYDTSWATNAASVRILAVKTQDGTGAAIAAPVTNDLFSAAAPSAGVFAKSLQSGRWRFLLNAFDGAGTPIGAPYFADCFLKAKATAVMMK